MKNLLLTWLILSCSGCSSSTVLTKNESFDTFSEDQERLITVEDWASTLGGAIAYTVVRGDIVIFTRNDFSKPESELYRATLTEERLKEFETAISEIPDDLIGKVFYREGIHGGSFLRINLSPNGSLGEDRIELENVYEPRLSPILDLINQSIPDEYNLRFDEQSERLSKRFLEHPIAHRPVWIQSNE